MCITIVFHSVKKIKVCGTFLQNMAKFVTQNLLELKNLDFTVNLHVGTNH